MENGRVRGVTTGDCASQESVFNANVARIVRSLSSLVVVVIVGVSIRKYVK